MDVGLFLRVDLTCGFSISLMRDDCAACGKLPAGGIFVCREDVAVATAPGTRVCKLTSCSVLESICKKEE